MIKLPKNIMLPFGIVAIGFIGLLLLKSLKSTPEQKPKEETLPLVNVQTVEWQPYRIHISSQGVSQPVTKTQLIAQVSGVVLRYNPAFNAGGLVKKGEVLIEIEQLDYQSALKTAKANLARAKAAFEQERALAKVAADDWKRAGRADSAPPLGLRKPQLEQEKANVLSAEVELERAQRDLERTRITAPYNAIVGKRNVDIGQFISVGGNIGELMATDVAEIRLPLSLSDYQRLQVAEGTTDVYLHARYNDVDHSWQGQIVRDEGVIDSNNRMLYLAVHVDDPYARQGSTQEPLRFGQFLHAKLYGSTTDSAVKIDKTSLVRNAYVFVVDDESLLQKRPVTIVGEHDEHVYVRGDIENGTSLVTTIVTRLVPGTKVTTVNSATESHHAD